MRPPHPHGLSAVARARDQARLSSIDTRGARLAATAALREPAFLAGLEPEEQADIAMRWARANHEGEVKRLDFLRSVSEHVKRGGRLQVGYTAGLTDARLIADAEKLEQTARDAESGAALN